MSKMKKIMALLLTAFVSLSIMVGCGSKTDADSSGKLKIGFMNTNLSNEFQVAMLDSAREKAKELNIELIEYDGMGDPAKQVSQMEQLISQKADAIVLAPYDKDALAPAVLKAKEAGIPLIIVNSTVVNMDQALAYVGSDDKVAGVMAMEELAKAIGNKGDIMMIRGPIGNSAEVGRTAGVEEVLKSNTNIKIVVDEPADWDREKAMKLVENKIQSGLNFVGVMAQNDEMALGAQMAIEAAGLKDKVSVIGIDAIPDALTAVADGKLIATVFQDAKSQASTALEVALKAAKGEAIEKEYMVPFKLITKENVNEYK